MARTELGDLVMVERCIAELSRQIAASRRTWNRQKSEGKRLTERPESSMSSTALSALQESEPENRATQFTLVSAHLSMTA